MTWTEIIQETVRQAGLTCRFCGACCNGPNNEVMVSPQEIYVLVSATGRSASEIAEPYPEWLKHDGGTFTFGWVLRRG